MSDAARVRPRRLVLLGHPVSHSLSPRFHNAALRAAGIPLEYVAIDTPPSALPDALEALRRGDGAGNVTIPHKEAARLACDDVTPVAARAGAVNTLWTDHGMLFGDNTDVDGFDRAVLELSGGVPRAHRVAVLGAGGAARAVLTAIERWPASDVVLYNRHPVRAERLAAEFSVVRGVAPDVTRAVDGATLIVNASPVGQHSDEMPVDPLRIAPGALAIDLVYRSGGTPWVRALRARDILAADGTTMLLEQGALSFERWFGFPPDRAAMRAALG